MATYLELVKDLARQTGSLSPSDIVAVSGAALTGRPEKMADWVRKAYVNIQNSRRDWRWLVTEFTASLIPGTARYAPATFNLTRFSAWMEDEEGYMPLSLYNPATGVSDEGEIRWVPYNAWRDRYGRGDQTSTYWNRPTEWSVSPQNELVFGPIPDVAYTIRGQYQKGPQYLTAAGDIPEMPARFHDLIMWEAQRLLLIHDGAYNENQYATQEVVILRQQLEIDQLPEVTVG